MKIGIMLRHMEQHAGGVYNYTHYLLEALLKVNNDHEYVLVYKHKSCLGRYGFVRPNVKEIAVETKSNLLWDQFVMCNIERKEQFDVIFNPKYSIPLFSKCKTVWVCHGLDWYLMPWASKLKDRFNHNIMVPLYVRKADAIIAVSDVVKEHLIKYFNKEPETVRRIYLGIHASFKKKYSEEELNFVKKRYHLPDRFFLYVGQIYPPKNFGRLLKAYAIIGPQNNIHLVVAGELRWANENYSKLIKKLNLRNWVIQLGWIQHEMLAPFYFLAEALLLPSLYEACPSPVLEAMATGCSLITSDRYGTKELGGNAALFIDPENVDSIASAMQTVLTDKGMKKILIENGFNRVGGYDWKKCAAETLHFLEEIAEKRSL